jgi:DNA-binding MarR family transcriptional regulator
VQEIREWEDSNLPLLQSRIAFDLFLLIGHKAALEEPLTVKEILNTLKYSDRGVRYVLERFIEHRWCRMVDHERDGRRKLIVASDVLLSKMADYERQVLQRYEALRIDRPV